MVMRVPRFLLRLTLPMFSAACRSPERLRGSLVALAFICSMDGHGGGFQNALGRSRALAVCVHAPGHARNVGHEAVKAVRFKGHMV